MNRDVGSVLLPGFVKKYYLHVQMFPRSLHLSLWKLKALLDMSVYYVCVCVITKISTISLW